MRRTRLSDFGAGLLAVVIVAVAVFFAFTKVSPFEDRFEFGAVFSDAENLKEGSPVRVAGIDVGEVTSVDAWEGDPSFAKVTMEVRDEGLPIHDDAELQISPRLFLEGNFVVELKPGSPSAPVIETGTTIPMDQTAHAVSFEEITKVLDKDTRGALQTLLDSYSRAYLKGGAEAIRDAIPEFAEAYRRTALANDALLGTREGDLRRVIRGQQRTFAALTRNPERLKSLVTSLNVTTAAFAREDEALEASIPAFRDVLETALPTLASVNQALPSVDAFVADALPAVRSTDVTLDAATPFIEQLQELVARDELQEFTQDLRETIPPLAEVSAENIPFLQENRLLASCTTDVLVPFARTPIPDPDFPPASGEPFYQEAQRAFVGLASESRTGDANGQWFRVNATSNGVNFLQLDGPAVGELFASPLLQPLGVRPNKPERRPPFRPDVPCETQEPPVMAAAGAEVTPARAATRNRDSEGVQIVERELRQLSDFLRRDRAGRPAINPLDYLGERSERRAAREKGLELNSDGLYRPREDGR